MDRISCNTPIRRGEARRIRPTRRSVSGVYAFRGEQGIAFESTLERDFLMRIEPVFCVLDVAPQPVRLPYRMSSGRASYYTPDFLVRYRLADRAWSAGRRPLLVEVKPREVLRAQWRELRPKYRAAVRYARDNDWEFRIFDESRIRDATWENVLFLRPYRGLSFPKAEVDAVLETLKFMGDAPVQYLVGRHYPVDRDRMRGYSLIWSLLAKGEIECDLARPLAWDAEVWMPTDE